MIRLLAAEVAGSFNFRLAFGVARIGSSRRSSTENKRTTSSGLAGTHAARIAVQRVRPLPLLERKRLLRDVVPPQPCPVLYANHVVGAGVSLYDAVCARDLDGQADGRYTPEATTWVKIKTPASSQAEGQADFFDARAARV